MSLNRVQKLLLSEYSDFEDLVLIESPFAQTTKDGWGLRQVHLGLTPSKLVLATDILPPLNANLFEINNYNIDPEIETFELIAIYPVECVNLSVYRNKKRQALKARFCNNRVYYFELGGFEKRGMFWNLWCEKVKFLCPTPAGSSRSETSVATSSTRSTLYLVDKRFVKNNSIRQLWCKFGPNYGLDTRFINEVVKSNNKWTNKFLFLGRDFKDNPEDYEPIMHKPQTQEFVKVKKRNIRTPPDYPSQMDQKNLNFGDSVQVNRFASGVFEGCNTGLYLTVDDYVTPVGYDTAMTTTTLTDISVDWNSVDYEEIAETAVLIWEYFGFSKQRNRLRHRRRYGFASKPLFLYGLGPWHPSNGDEYSLHLKRAVSTVNLTADNGTTLPVTRQQLVASISCPDFTKHDEHNFINGPIKPLILFWTPGYWYRPVTAKDAYIEQQRYLKKIRANHEKCSKKKLKCLGKRRRKFFTKFHKSHKDSEDDMDDDKVATKKKRKSKFIANFLSTNNSKLNEQSDRKQANETSLQHLKRLLKPGNSLTAFDFDSTTLAQQLTLLDKDLFLKIPTDELSHILWQRSTKNAPNVTAMVAFSHRISCLIGSEILRAETEKVRARLIARFINVADKCHRLSNFHSCRSVLSGLQSPPIFRLRKTWAYVRKKHASKYQVFEYLCRLYRDPRMPTYQKTFFIFSQHPPYLPWIGHISAKLLNKMPEYKIQTLQSRELSSCASKVSMKSKTPNTCQQNNFFSKLFNFISPSPPSTSPKTIGAGDEIRPNKKPRKKFRGLHAYLKPPNCHQEARIDLLQETVEFFEKCQLGAVSYNFSINQMTREFLLKARYFEDEDNFFNSLSLENNKTK